MAGKYFRERVFFFFIHREIRGEREKVTFHFLIHVVCSRVCMYRRHFLQLSARWKMDHYHLVVCFSGVAH